MSAPKPRRWPGRVAATAPVVLLAVSLVAGIWGFVVIHSTFPFAPLPQQIFSTLALFAGGYLPLSADPSDAVPPDNLGIPAVLAFGVTIAAAGTIVITLSTKVRDVLRAAFSHPDLVVIGSGATAAAIVRSCVEKSARALLITENSEGAAARACLHVIPVVTIGSLAEAGTYGVSRRVLRRSANVVIATDSDSTNLELRRAITVTSSGNNARRSVVAVVRDAQLVDSMRPGRIRELTDESVTCPAENIAEHVCLLIDAATTGKAAITPIAGGVTDKQFTRTQAVVDRVVVHVDDGGEASEVADTIRLWVTRQVWGRSHLGGGDEDHTTTEGFRNPIVPIVVNEPAGERDLMIRIHCAAESSATVRNVLDTMGIAATRRADLTIVVADQQLATTAITTYDDRGIRLDSGWAWLAARAPLDRHQDDLTRILVVDPDRVGLDANLVIDDVRLQWARVFDQTHSFMFAGGYAIGGWLPGDPLGSRTAEAETAAVEKMDPESRADKNAVRTTIDIARKRISNRHSSELAVQHMIVQLQLRGMAVVRHDGPDAPALPILDKDTVSTIARNEHEDWRTRTWADTSPRRGFRPPRSKQRDCAYYSAQKLGDYSWDDLLAKSADADPSVAGRFRVVVNYNTRIVTETYPAIAARFGYRIVALDEPGVV